MHYVKRKFLDSLVSLCIFANYDSKFQGHNTVPSLGTHVPYPVSIFLFAFCHSSQVPPWVPSPPPKQHQRPHTLFPDWRPPTHLASHALFPRRDFLLPNLTSSSPDSGLALPSLQRPRQAGDMRSARPSASEAGGRRRGGLRPPSGAHAEGRGRGESRSRRPPEGRGRGNGGGEERWSRRGGGPMGTRAPRVQKAPHTHGRRSQGEDATIGMVY